MRTSAGVGGFAVVLPGFDAPEYVDLISKRPDHTAWAAASMLFKCMDLILQRWPDAWARVEEIAVWVDKGPHFTGYVFLGQALVWLVKKFGLPVSLNFFEVYHGKFILDASFGQDGVDFEEAVRCEDVNDSKDCARVLNAAAVKSGRKFQAIEFDFREDGPAEMYTELSVAGIKQMLCINLRDCLSPPNQEQLNKFVAHYSRAFTAVGEL